MKLERARESLRMVAEKEGISEGKVKYEIEAAIAEAMKTVYASGDKRRIAMWESIPRVGETPTAEEFVAFMSEVAGLIMACGE